MQYGLVGGEKMEPAKGLKGTCMGCGRDVVAKCGERKIHHWAHKSLKDCDSWSEPESQWHRNWKNEFPTEYREVIFKDEVTGELHRADIHTKDGITIEFQNSPISDEELRSRDKFYSKLIWVVNGLKFKGSFRLTTNIPDPESNLLNNYEFVISKHLILCRKEEVSSPDTIGYEILSINHPELQQIKKSTKHFIFDWRNSHSAWFSSSSPVFFDFGDELLYWLKKRDQFSSVFRYIEVVKKSDFLLKYKQ